METLTDQNWLLSVGTFLPLVGVLGLAALLLGGAIAVIRRF